jgi:membrane protein
MASVRPLAVARNSIREFGEDGCTTQAAAIAYSAFFAIFPMLLGVIALISPLVSSEVVRDQIVGSAVAYLPGSGELIEATTSGVIDQRGPAGLIAAVLMLVSALGVFQAVVHALNVAFEAPRERGLVPTLLLAAFMVVGVGGLMLLSLAVTAATQAATDWLPLPQVGPLGGRSLWPVAQTALTIVIGFTTFGALYAIAPNVRLSWREVAPGAAVAAVLFELAKWGFVFYVKNFTNYAAVYGAIGAVIALLTWCYVSAAILLLGAEVSSEYAKLRRAALKGTASPRPAPPIQVARPSPLRRPLALMAMGVLAGLAFALARRPRGGHDFSVITPGTAATAGSARRSGRPASS